MKKIFIKFTVMSVALVLFCVSAVAQNEKSTKNVTYSSPGVTITPSTSIELTPGETKVLTITPNPGYYNVTIYYNGTPCRVDRPIVGNCFTATYSGTVNYGGTLVISANDDAIELEKGYLDVVVEMIPEGLWKMASARGRTTITITIVSSSGKN